MKCTLSNFLAMNDEQELTLVSNISLLCACVHAYMDACVLCGMVVCTFACISTCFLCHLLVSLRKATLLVLASL